MTTGGGLQIRLTHQPLERVEADLAVAGFFADERPLRGGAARADWRLCGGLSRRIEGGDLSGRSGEALLVACGRALSAPRLMLLGLGPRQDYDRLRVTDEMRSAMTRCLDLGLEHVVMSPLGIAADDIPRHAPAIVAGIVEAWAGSGSRLRLEICVRRSEIAGIHRAFDEARRATGATTLALQMEESRA